MKKKLIVSVLVASMCLTSLIGTYAATETKTASAGRTEKSWVGIQSYDDEIQKTVTP